MAQSPLLGFNNNVKHRGRLFHIQTEDSGVRHPHVITHLFMDGGRILKTVKTSYAEHLGSDKLNQTVRELMKEQHKMMFIALRDGQFDQALDSTPPPSMGTPPTLPHGSFPPVSAQSVPDTTSGAPAPPPERRSSGKGSAISAKAPPPPPPAPRVGSGTMPAVTPPAAMGSSASMKAAQVEGGPATGVRPVPRREAPELFGTPAADGSVVNVVADQAAAAASQAPAKKEQPGSGRYAASRPAAIFSNARTADAGGSIFGDDLISEKSLDEVILSYLSDDLETTKK